jgi:hypothetical protein
MNNFSNDIVCDMLFNQIQKPKNTVMCKAINLYNNRYRINVYTENERDNLTYRKIEYSCFAIVDKNDKLNIIDQTPHYNILA